MQSSVTEVGRTCEYQHERIRFYGADCPLCKVGDMLRVHLKSLNGLVTEVGQFNTALYGVFHDPKQSSEPVKKPGVLIEFPNEVEPDVKRPG